MKLPNVDRALADLYGTPIPKADMVRLRGDASTRSYFRARLVNGRPGLPESVIVMELPEEAFDSDEGGARPHTKRLPFLEVAELLTARGLPVPKVYAEDLANRVVLLEDLGDLTLHETLLRAPRSEWTAWYGRAIDLLAELHDRCADLPDSSVVRRRRFDRALLEWELDHFREWGLEALYGPLEENAREALSDAFATIVRRIDAMPRGFVHRDYQSKNLMVGPDRDLVMIDFQDALTGPRAYDLVALLCDSYVDLNIDLQEAMIDRYAALRRVDRETILEEFWWTTIHRKLKDAGRFVFIDRVRKNPDFLPWFPQSLVYAGRALERTQELGELRSLLETAIRGFPDEVSEPPSSME